MSTQSVLRRVGLRAAAVTAASALMLVGVANSASAHVTVSSPDAKPGGYAKLVFRVPSESDTASTTKLVVTLARVLGGAGVVLGLGLGVRRRTAKP